MNWLKQNIRVLGVGLTILITLCTAFYTAGAIIQAQENKVIEKDVQINKTYLNLMAKRLDEKASKSDIEAIKEQLVIIIKLLEKQDEMTNKRLDRLEKKIDKYNSK